MIHLNEIDLHDAVLKKVEINISDKTVILSIDYYEGADAVSRTELLLLFSGFSSVSNIVDIDMGEERFLPKKLTCGCLSMKLDWSRQGRGKVLQIGAEC